MAEKKAAPEGEGKGKKTKLFILIGAGVFVALLAAGGGAWYMSRSSAPEVAAGTSAPQMAQGGEGGAGIGPMVDIEAFVINILDENESRYLKAALTLEVDTPATVAEVTSRMPQIRDAILLLVGNKTYDELRDLQGKLQLRAELASKLNALLQGGQVRKIYFTDFVVQ